MTHVEDTDDIFVDKPSIKGMQLEDKFASLQTRPVRLESYRPADGETTDIAYHAAEMLEGEVGHFEQSPEAHPFRFYDLPPEVRNQIYRELLLTQNAIWRVPNPKFFTFHRPVEPLNMNEGSNVGDGPVGYQPVAGTVLCENIHVEKSTCDMALLRVDRKMYEEASHVFSQNVWVAVHINTGGLARDLKSRGYNVQTEGWKYRNSVKCALDINIHFNTRIALTDGRHDSFLISLSAIAPLPRALATLNRFAHAEFTFSVHPDFKGKFGQESELVTAFRQLQVVKMVKVTEDDYVFEEMAFAMSVLQLDLQDDWHNRDSILRMSILSRLQANFLDAQEACSQGNWAKAADDCELSMAYIDGVYRFRTSVIFDEDSDGDMAPRINGIFRDLLLILAEAKFRIGAYACAVKYATHFLSIDSNDWGDINAAAFFRGRAYAAMEEHSMALADYDDIAARLTQSADYISSLSCWDRPPSRRYHTLPLEGEFLKLKAILAEDPPAPLMAFAHLKLEMQIERLLEPDTQDPVCHHKDWPLCSTNDAPCYISMDQSDLADLEAEWEDDRPLLYNF